ncbi:hypothetical protein RHMOL_Rhmol10G0203900 [Rhododendron molle]|uniref:Uncharacterized protein n=2 Tax=Rhododendron molle TaxID=49168 RepID=A0ACC0M433_RHOML|nr:hypothetical protein RHMOL_Rhmol10G0203900 [Rhododendron molle]KAI8535819.1 hypothetical protein RHMOL_Rhmol10G0203900 [Rhododendron molle]
MCSAALVSPPPLSVPLSVSGLRQWCGDIGSGGGEFPVAGVLLLAMAAGPHKIQGISAVPAILDVNILDEVVPTENIEVRPSSSIRTSGVSVNGEYVTHLKGKVQEQVEKIQEQFFQEQAEGIEAANNKIDELVEAKEEQGRTLASVMEGFTG